jgi:hypothetical protein
VTVSFADDVEAVVGPMLMKRGFVLDEIDDSIDEGGRPAAVVYYRSTDCKIQIYKSSREGNVNCMIAPAGAKNEFGPLDKSLQWHYLNEFSPAPDVPLEELVKSVSYKAKTEREQLEKVRDRIAEYYDDACAGVLQKYRPT